METKKLNSVGLSQVWAEIVKNFLAKKEGEELKKKLESLNIPSGALASLDEVDEEHLAEALKTLIQGKAEKAVTLAGYGIADAYSKEETYSRAEADSAINDAVKRAVAGVYVVKGSIAFAELPKSGMEKGFVYNITDAFTTTEAFVEGAGKEYPAGTNVVYTDAGWDVMAGTYDFSAFMLKSDLVDITEEEIKAICVMPS